MQHSQRSQAFASSLFKPGSVRCQEVDDSSRSASSIIESSDGKPSEHPISSVSSSKRKASTELETLKETKVTIVAVDNANAATTLKLPHDLSSHAKRPMHPEYLLNQEHKNARKTFRLYAFENVQLGKGARYCCIITLDRFYHFTGEQWYTADSFMIYRCVMDVPDNFIFVTPGENRDDQKVTTNISDIVWVYLANKNHWIMVHLALKKWRVTYYDPMLGNKTAAEQEHSMRIWCAKAIDDVGRRQRSSTVSHPMEQPEMARKYTIAQNDSHSCGPFALREIEKLMNLPVQDDLEDPLRIRLRHLATIHQKMNQRMVFEDPDDPAQDHGPAILAQRSAQLEIWSAKAKSVPETLSTVVEQQILAEFGGALETNSKASTTSSSPELPYSLLPPKPSESVCENNPNILDSSQHILVKDQPATHGMPRPRILKELESSLKVAGEHLKRRVKPEFKKFYRIPLKGVEDEHLSTVEEDGHDDCNDEYKVDADESDSDEDDENDNGDNDHADGQPDGLGGENGDGEDWKSDTETENDNQESSDMYDCDWAPRPSEDVIRSLTVEQRKQVRSLTFLIPF